MVKKTLFLVLILIVWTTTGVSQSAEGDFIVHDFHFMDGQTLPQLRIHYMVCGTPVKDKSGNTQNAVVIMHGTTGSGHQFLTPVFSGVLFGPGGLLDTTKYFVILPDDIGHGKSSKPSDGLHAHFPHYGYRDMVEAEYRLVTEGLGVNHLRLVTGTSMGGMHTWLWGEIHPDFMDALMPLASLPIQISGRNRVWRRMIIDAIRYDPEWKNGEYAAQPQSLRIAAEMLFYVSSNPPVRQEEMPTLAESDTVIDRFVDYYFKHADANDVLYAIESSYDYDPVPNLEKIKARLFAINSEDDLINPPELRILENAIERVPHGQYVIIPFSDKTRGHGTHTLAAIWKQYLGHLLKESAR